MLWFRNVIMQLTVTLVTSALATLLLQSKWKAVILTAVVAAASIVLLSVAILIAEMINRRWHR